MKKILIINSNYYKKISNNLVLKAKDKLLKTKFKVKILEVPGVYEIPIAIRKNIKKLISYLPDKSLVFFTSSNMSRSMNQIEIEESIGENINFNKNPNRVYNNLLSQASPDDLIIITGSNYIAKEIFYEK